MSPLSKRSTQTQLGSFSLNLKFPGETNCVMCHFLAHTAVVIEIGSCSIDMAIGTSLCELREGEQFSK